MPFTVADLKNCFSPRCWAAMVAAGGAAVLSGCVVAPLDGGYADYADYGYSSTTVYTHYGYPPPPRVEYRTMAPSASHVWVGGDWFWHDSRYDWRPGRWAPPGYRYLPPPPPRPMVRPPRPQVLPVPRPDLRPEDRPRPPFFRPGGDHRPQPPEGRPDPRPQPPQGRPDGGWPRPPQMRPERPDSPPPQMRPEVPRPDNARPPRRDGEERRGPLYRRDRDDERGRR